MASQATTPHTITDAPYTTRSVKNGEQTITKFGGKGFYTFRVGEDRSKPNHLTIHVEPCELRWKAPHWDFDENTEFTSINPSLFEWEGSRILCSPKRENEIMLVPTPEIQNSSLDYSKLEYCNQDLSEYVRSLQTSKSKESGREKVYKPAYARHLSGRTVSGFSDMCEKFAEMTWSFDLFDVESPDRSEKQDTQTTTDQHGVDVTEDDMIEGKEGLEDLQHSRSKAYYVSHLCRE
jgi:hypothetical protein